MSTLVTRVARRVVDEGWGACLLALEGADGLWEGRGQQLQLDDVVALDRVLPSGQKVSIYGIVSQVQARHEGARRWCR